MRAVAAAPAAPAAPAPSDSGGSWVSEWVLGPAPGPSPAAALAAANSASTLPAASYEAANAGARRSASPRTTPAGGGGGGPSSTGGGGAGLSVAVGAIALTRRASYGWTVEVVPPPGGLVRAPAGGAATAEFSALYVRSAAPLQGGGGGAAPVVVSGTLTITNGLGAAAVLSEATVEAPQPGGLGPAIAAAVCPRNADGRVVVPGRSGSGAPGRLACAFSLPWNGGGDGSDGGGETLAASFVTATVVAGTGAREVLSAPAAFSAADARAAPLVVTGQCAAITDTFRGASSIPSSALSSFPLPLPASAASAAAASTGGGGKDGGPGGEEGGGKAGRPKSGGPRSPVGDQRPPPLLLPAAVIAGEKAPDVAGTALAAAFGGAARGPTRLACGSVRLAYTVRVGPFGPDDCGARYVLATVATANPTNGTQTTVAATGGAAVVVEGGQCGGGGGGLGGGGLNGGGGGGGGLDGARLAAGAADPSDDADGDVPASQLALSKPSLRPPQVLVGGDMPQYEWRVAVRPVGGVLGGSSVADVALLAADGAAAAAVVAAGDGGGDGSADGAPGDSGRDGPLWSGGDGVVGGEMVSVPYSGRRQAAFDVTYTRAVVQAKQGGGSGNGNGGGSNDGGGGSNDGGGGSNGGGGKKALFGFVTVSNPNLYEPLLLSEVQVEMARVSADTGSPAPPLSARASCARAAQGEAAPFAPAVRALAEAGWLRLGPAMTSDGGGAPPSASCSFLLPFDGEAGPLTVVAVTADGREAALGPASPVPEGGWGGGMERYGGGSCAAVSAVFAAPPGGGGNSGSDGGGGLVGGGASADADAGLPPPALPLLVPRATGNGARLLPGERGGGTRADVLCGGSRTIRYAAALGPEADDRCGAFAVRLAARANPTTTGGGATATGHGDLRVAVVGCPASDPDVFLSDVSAAIVRPYAWAAAASVQPEGPLVVAPWGAAAAAAAAGGMGGAAPPATAAADVTVSFTRTALPEAARVSGVVVLQNPNTSPLRVAQVQVEASSSLVAASGGGGGGGGGGKPPPLLALPAAPVFANADCPQAEDGSVTIPAAGSLACRFSVPFPAEGAGTVVARVQSPDSSDGNASASSSSSNGAVSGRGGGEAASAPAAFDFSGARASPPAESGACAVVSDGFSHPNGRTVAPSGVSRPPAAGGARRVCSPLGQTVRYRAFFSAPRRGGAGVGGGGGTCGEFSAMLTARANPATGDQPTSTSRVPVRVKVLCPGEAVGAGAEGVA